MSKTVFITTVFPGIESYLPDFFRSIHIQSYQNFDLLVMNDGLASIKEFLPENFNVHMEMYIPRNANNPAAIREEAIEIARNKAYEVVVFGDADDYFQENRVELCLDYLLQEKIIVNELSLVNQEGLLISENYFSNRLLNKQRIDLGFIENKNIFGLSNSAFKMEILRNYHSDTNVIAFDWFFFTQLLMNSATDALFTNETISYYRQHEQNIIGINEISEKKIKKGILAKKEHYRGLSEKSEYFVKYRCEMDFLFNFVDKSIENMAIYMEIVKKNSVKFPLWWEDIVAIEN